MVEVPQGLMAEAMPAHNRRELTAAKPTQPGSPLRVGTQYEFFKGLNKNVFCPLNFLAVI